MSIDSIPDFSISLLSPTFPFSLPHTDYRLKVTLEKPDPEPANHAADEFPPAATVELRIRQSYMLYLEPIRGYRVTMDEDFIVSPEVTVRFKIHLSPLISNSHFSPYIQFCVSKRLASFPIVGDGLREFIKPHIQNTVVYLARRSGLRKAFKVVFSVNVIKIDLVDKEECDRIHSPGI